MALKVLKLRYKQTAAMNGKNEKKNLHKFKNSKKSNKVKKKKPKNKIK